jgi:uncharacterized protein YcsI (UPF0317 family)
MNRLDDDDDDDATEEEKESSMQEIREHAQRVGPVIARAGGGATGIVEPGLPLQHSYKDPGDFRQMVRENKYVGPTNGVCAGYMQCNLVVLNQSEARDFLLFCQRNPQACPLLEVCMDDDDDAENPCRTSYSPQQLAKGVDLRTDLPKYSIFRNGVWEKDVTHVMDVWPKKAAAFLIGCSFSCDGALREAGIPLRSAEAGRNIPMYTTNRPCVSAGKFRGHLVVSMKPIPCTMIAQEVLITQQYPEAHGPPICVGGDGSALGITDLGRPDWGDPIAFDAQVEVPVFHACGVTPQQVLRTSQEVEFAITHAPGHMLVTDCRTTEFRK